MIFRSAALSQRTPHILHESIIYYGYRTETLRERERGCRPGARRQWPGENLAVAYAQGRARYWAAMRRRCPESGYVLGYVQAPVMR
jgi:hypothetical protein